MAQTPCDLNNLSQNIWEDETPQIKIQLDSLRSLFHKDPKLAYDYSENLIRQNDENLNATIIALYFKSAASGELGLNKEMHENAMKAYKLLTPEHEKTLLNVHILTLYANILLEINDVFNSEELLEEANRVLDSIYPCKNVMKFTNLNDIAKIKKKRNDIKGEFEFYEKAMEEAKGISNSLWLSSAYNNLGLFYFNQNKDYLKALEYYNYAKETLHIEDQILFAANIDENIAKVYFEQQQYGKASILLKEISKVRLENQDSIGAFWSDIYLLKSLKELGKEKELEKLLSKDDIIFLGENYVFQDDLHDFNGILKKYLKFKVDYYLNKGDSVKYRNSMETYLYFIENYNDVIREKTLNAQQNYINLLKYQHEKQISLKEDIYQEKRKSASYKNRIFLGIILIFGLLLTILLLFINRLKIKLVNARYKEDISQLTLQNLEFKKNNISDLLKSNKEELINLSNHLVLETNFLQNLTIRLNDLKESDTLNFKVLHRSIIFDIKNKIKLNNRQSKLRGSDLTNLNHEFTKKLIELYPSLTPNEREICSFIKLNLSIKEIAQIRNMSIDAVKTMRSRIRKKFGLGRKDKLENFIQSQL